MFLQYCPIVAQKDFLTKNASSGPEMEFLDISLLLHDINSLFYWRMLKKTKFFSGFKNPYKKIRETRKLESSL